MEKLLWLTKQIKWVDLIPFEQNARKIKEANKRKLDESLDEFDVVEIPVVDADNRLIGGHQRRARMLARGRGEELVDVRYPNRKLTEVEFKKLNLLLNSEKFKGEFDFELLEKHFAEFALQEDFGIEMPDYSEVLSASDEEVSEPEYAIVQKFSEKYTAFVVVCTNEIDENHVAEKLGIDREQCYKSSKIGTSHIVNAKRLIDTWKQ